MARPTKLTPEIQEHIVQALQLGASYELAANYGGISYKTLTRWMQTGQRQADSEYGDFYQAINKARSDMVIRALLKIEIFPLYRTKLITVCFIRVFEVKKYEF